MQIIDSVKDITTCFENGLFSKRKWEIYIEKVYPGLKNLLEADAASYDYEREILPVLNAVYSSREKLEMMHRSFCKVTAGLEERIRDVFHAEIHADIVLCLGLCNGAGWAVEIHHRPTVLLGIEKIIELDWVDEISMIGLIDHELGHLWHFQERTRQREIKTSADKALWQLYSEGMAMYFEHSLCGDYSFYHQNKNGWLHWCSENKKRLFQKYNFLVENGESVQDFFGDWCSLEGHSDIGYFLGAELVRKAVEKYPLPEVLNLSMDQIRQLLLLCAENDIP